MEGRQVSAEKGHFIGWKREGSGPQQKCGVDRKGGILILPTTYCWSPLVIISVWATLALAKAAKNQPKAVYVMCSLLYVGCFICYMLHIQWCAIERKWY